MWYIEKTINISCGHHLDGHEECGKPHGHNYRITVRCKNRELINGMVIDFKNISNYVKSFDHEYLNDSLENPTAERLAEMMCQSIPFCYEIEIEETPGSIVRYVKD